MDRISDVFLHFNTPPRNLDDVLKFIYETNRNLTDQVRSFLDGPLSNDEHLVHFDLVSRLVGMEYRDKTLTRIYVKNDLTRRWGDQYSRYLKLCFLVNGYDVARLADGTVDIGYWISRNLGWDDADMFSTEGAEFKVELQGAPSASPIVMTSVELHTCVPFTVHLDNQLLRKSGVTHARLSEGFNAWLGKNFATEVSEAKESRDGVLNADKRKPETLVEKITSTYKNLTGK